MGEGEKRKKIPEGIFRRNFCNPCLLKEATNTTTTAAEEKIFRQKMVCYLPNMFRVNKSNI